MTPSKLATLALLILAATLFGCHRRHHHRSPAGAPDAARSSLAPSRTTGVLANGTDAATITVTVRDAAGRALAGHVVALAAAGSGVVVVQPAAATDASGVATGTITATLPGAKTVTATVDPGAGAVVLAQTATVTFVAAAGAALAFVGEPVATAPGAAIASGRGVTVELRDAGGAVRAGATDVVSIALGAGTGALSGTVTAAAVNGVATFRNLRVSPAGTGFTLVASAPGYTSATSASFNVGAVAAADGIGHLDAGVMNLTRGGPDDGPTADSFSIPRDVVVDEVGHRLFVADMSNQRVLVFNLSTTNDFTGVDRVADFVLGQPDFQAGRGVGGDGPSGMSNPRGLALDVAGGRLFVAEEGNGRVLVFDVTTITNGEAAVHVLGKPDFAAATGSSSPAQDSLSQPTGLAYDGGTPSRLFVADSGNSRIMVFDVASITDGENATGVLGVSSFTVQGGASAAPATLAAPNGVAYDAATKKLYVSDGQHRRIVRYDVATVTNGEAADAVYGQPNLTSDTAGTSGNSMNFPEGVAYDAAGNRVFASDINNHRVLIFDAAASGQPASAAIGQADLLTGGRGTAQAALSFPRGLTFAPAQGRLWVADTGNHRILEFEAASLGFSGTASDGLGHLDAGVMNYTRSGAHDGPRADTLFNPDSVALDATNHRLFVGESGNRRVVVYNLSSQNDFNGVDRVADFVLGQPDFRTRIEDISRSRFGPPQGLAFDPVTNRLFVADYEGLRVLVFDVTTITDGEDAEHVIGQAGFSAGSFDTAADRLGGPIGLAIDAPGRRLFVADSDNARVLVFNIATILDGEAAIRVAGVGDFITSGPFQADVDTFGYPYGLAYAADRSLLFVADDAGRVLVFDANATTMGNGDDAVNVLGQADFTADDGTPSAAALGNATYVDYDAAHKRLFVSDFQASRILIFDVATITDGEPAVGVLGQPSFTSDGQGTSATTLRFPLGLVSDPTGERIFVADQGNRRVLVIDAP